MVEDEARVALHLVVHAGLGPDPALHQHPVLDGGRAPGGLAPAGGLVAVGGGLVTVRVPGAAWGAQQVAGGGEAGGSVGPGPPAGGGVTGRARQGEALGARVVPWSVGRTAAVDNVAALLARKRRCLGLKEDGFLVTFLYRYQL